MDRLDGLAIIVVGGVLLYMIEGCATVEPGAVQVKQLVDEVAALALKVDVTKTTTAGGDVTVGDPWTCRILASLGPVAVLAYILLHRSWRARKLIDKLKGKPT